MAEEPWYCSIHNQHYWFKDGCAECYREDSVEPIEEGEEENTAYDRKRQEEVDDKDEPKTLLEALLVGKKRASNRHNKDL